MESGLCVPRFLFTFLWWKPHTPLTCYNMFSLETWDILFIMLLHSWGIPLITNCNSFTSLHLPSHVVTSGAGVMWPLTLIISYLQMLLFTSPTACWYHNQSVNINIFQLKVMMTLRSYHRKLTFLNVISVKEWGKKKCGLLRNGWMCFKD